MTTSPWVTRRTPDGLAVHTWAGSPADAPVLLLLHGLTDSGPSWEGAARRWGAGWQVVCPDALGHGASRRWTAAELAGPDPMEQLYAALARLVASLAVASGGPVVVGGHSMGGALAGLLAARRPAEVRAALLEDPAWREYPQDDQARQGVVGRVMETMEARTDLAAVVRRGRERNPRWPGCEIEPWARAKADGDLAFLRSGLVVVHQPWQQAVAALRVPTLVVTGTREVILDPARRAEVERLGSPVVEVAVVEGAGHCVRRDETEAYHARVDPWLEARRPSADAGTRADLAPWLG